VKEAIVELGSRTLRGKRVIKDVASGSSEK